MHDGDIVIVIDTYVWGNACVCIVCVRAATAAGCLLLLAVDPSATPAALQHCSNSLVSAAAVCHVPHAHVANLYKNNRPSHATCFTHVTHVKPCYEFYTRTHVPDCPSSNATCVTHVPASIAKGTATKGGPMPLTEKTRCLQDLEAAGRGIRGYTDTA